MSSKEWSKHGKLTTRVFARKIIRLISDGMHADVQKEVNAIESLCRKVTHPNIVKVFRHGWLYESSYYYIDMQLCSFNLESFIYEESIFIQIGTYIRGVESEFYRCIVLEVFKDILSGVEFIHSHGQVHRDLKPRNSMIERRG